MQGKRPVFLFYAQSVGRRRRLCAFPFEEVGGPDAAQGEGGFARLQRHGSGIRTQNTQAPSIRGTMQAEHAKRIIFARFGQSPQGFVNLYFHLQFDIRQSN